MAVNQMCRNCKLFDIESAKDKAGRVHKDWSARCLWQSTEVYPISVTRSVLKSRPSPNYVVSTDGKDCPCFVERDK